MSKRYGAITILLGLVCLWPTSVLGHARLKSAEPSPGATLNTPPTAIGLTFSETLIGRFSGVTISRSGKVITTGPVRSDGSRLIVPLKGKLDPGHYSVSWHVVSADTHRMTGSYSFTIGR